MIPEHIADILQSIRNFTIIRGYSYTSLWKLLKITDIAKDDFVQGKVDDIQVTTVLYLLLKHFQMSIDELIVYKDKILPVIDNTIDLIQGEVKDGQFISNYETIEEILKQYEGKKLEITFKIIGDENDA